jgi:hypothetical protein
MAWLTADCVCDGYRVAGSSSMSKLIMNDVMPDGLCFALGWSAVDRRCRFFARSAKASTAGPPQPPKLFVPLLFVALVFGVPVSLAAGDLTP